MGDCDDLDLIIASDVDQAEGKSGEDVSPSAAAIARPSARILGNSIDRVPQLLAKAVRR